MTDQDKKADDLETPEIKHAPNWPPQPTASVDPSLHATLDDITDHQETKSEYIDQITEQLKKVYDPEISTDIYNLSLIHI